MKQNTNERIFKVFVEATVATGQKVNSTGYILT